MKRIIAINIAIFLSLFSANTFAAVVYGIQGHSAGDAIAVRTDDEVISWCDFSKQIVVTDRSVLCAYNGNK